jgi:uncharacterized protein (DUF433 family)
MTSMPARRPKNGVSAQALPDRHRREMCGLVAPQLDRITVDPTRIRDRGVTVATIMGRCADGMSEAEILRDHPDPERDDLRQALRLAAWLARAG